MISEDIVHILNKNEVPEDFKYCGLRGLWSIGKRMHDSSSLVRSDDKRTQRKGQENDENNNSGLLRKDMLPEHAEFLAGKIISRIKGPAFKKPHVQ